MTMELGRQWDFAIHTRVGGELARDDIPRLSLGLQQVFDDSTEMVRSIRLSPPPAELDLEIGLLLDGARWERATDATWTSAIASSLRIDNPELTRVPDLDCASCHLATRARRAAMAVRPVDVALLPEAFDGGAATAAGDAGGSSSRAVMSFAYLGRDPMVSDRTLNESVVAARRLDALE
jgi:hypothetical protein